MKTILKPVAVAAMSIAMLAPAALLLATGTAPANAQSTCPQCMGDGFPHPNFQQPVSAQQMQCIRTALARYGKSTVALDNAVRACSRR